MAGPTLDTVEGEARDRLGYWIERAREQRGMTRHELAARLGVTYTTVYTWETGRKTPSILMLGPLCDALGVSPDLFRDLPEAPPNPVEQYLRPAAREGFARGTQRGGRRTRP